MKKIIVFLLSISILIFSGCSCSDPTPVNVSGEPTIGLFTSIQKFSFEDCDYIWFRKYEGPYAGYSGGIVHDPHCTNPECPYLTEYE